MIWSTRIAEVECDFNLINLCCTPLCACIDITTLESLMKICLFLSLSYEMWEEIVEAYKQGADFINTTCWLEH